MIQGWLWQYLSSHVHSCTVTLTLPTKKGRILLLPLNLSQPMARFDQENAAEVTLCNFGGQALRASTFPAWNTPSWKPAAISKGHHAVRKCKRPIAENLHTEDYQSTTMRVKPSRTFQPSHSRMKPSEWSSPHHMQQKNSPAKPCLNSWPTNHEQIKHCFTPLSFGVGC